MAWNNRSNILKVYKIMASGYCRWCFFLVISRNSGIYTSDKKPLLPRSAQIIIRSTNSIFYPFLPPYRSGLANRISILWRWITQLQENSTQVCELKRPSDTSTIHGLWNLKKNGVQSHHSSAASFTHLWKFIAIFLLPIRPKHFRILDNLCLILRNF